MKWAAYRFWFSFLLLILVSVMPLHAQEAIQFPLTGLSGEKIFGLGRVSSGAYSPDGKTIATVGSLGALLWDVETEDLLRTFIGHTGYVSSVVFSPDGSRILTGSADKTAKLWDMETGELLQIGRAHV